MLSYGAKRGKPWFAHVHVTGWNRTSDASRFRRALYRAELRSLVLTLAEVTFASKAGGFRAHVKIRVEESNLDLHVQSVVSCP